MTISSLMVLFMIHFSNVLIFLYITAPNNTRTCKERLFGNILFNNPGESIKITKKENSVPGHIISRHTKFIFIGP
jgi:hypothetical protein